MKQQVGTYTYLLLHMNAAADKCHSLHWAFFTAYTGVHARFCQLIYARTRVTCVHAESKAYLCYNSALTQRRIINDS